MFKYNAGEWSEVYAFLQILADAKIVIGDKFLNPLPTPPLQINSIMRHNNEMNEILEYQCGNTVKVLDPEKNQLCQITNSEIKSKANDMFRIITGNLIGSPTFSMSDDINQFLTSIYCDSVKARSIDKADIKIELYDYISNGFKSEGFSIKSQIGSPSTLLNPSEATKLRYRIKYPLGTSNVDMQKFTRKDFAQLISSGVQVEFDKCLNETFNNNLRFIDGDLPTIVSKMLLYYYSNRLEGSQTLKDAIKILAQENPCNYPQDKAEAFYSHKTKNLLSDIALGMRPNSEWTGYYEANGGYLIVKKNGEIICFHFYNRDAFREYLLENVRFDTPSTTRHDFGRITTDLQGDYIDLCLQIRFL